MAKGHKTTDDMHGACHLGTGRVYIGCAGWSLPKAHQAAFASEGSHLERYASRLKAVEINSSFYTPHKPATYARWADSVPADFRFSVKVPKAITHEHRLKGSGELMATFLSEVGHLGCKLGCLLVQLPPSLAFDRVVADAFFAMLRAQHEGAVAIEPRHATWFGDETRELLMRNGINLVRADPAPCARSAWPFNAAEPKGASRSGSRSVYYRLHGAPRIYYDTYDEAYLRALSKRMRTDVELGADVWCVFDNTALGAATVNALALASNAAVKGGNE